MNYIIGGGITGLIYNFYHQGSIIISPELGGQLNHPWPLGPRVLKKTPAVEHFMGMLFGKYPEPTVYKIMFLYAGRLYPNRLPEMERDYCIKVDRSPEDGKPMNNGEDTLIGYNLKVVMMKLKQFVSDPYHIKGTAISVEGDNIRIDMGGLKIRASLNPDDTVIGSVPVKSENTKKRYFYLIPNKDKIPKNTIVYVPDREIPFHRVTTFREELIYESPIPLEGSFEYIEKFELKTQVLSEEPEKNPNIKYIGRYGESKHSLRAHDIIERMENERKTREVEKGLLLLLLPERE